ncbi:putative serine/threonine-protein kinase PkwA [Anaerolineae bacterium]|nr:putative serine/threonine-protein kinase PkwA [Anaerolineae bacterium]
MVILDAVANVAPYAFVLPYIWISAAYMIAAVRVRHTQPRRQVLSLAAASIFTPFTLLNQILLLILIRNMGESPVWMWLLWYGYAILFPLLTLFGLRQTSKVVPVWRRIGYTHLSDFILLHVPLIDLSSSATAASDSVDPDPSSNRRIYLLALTASICAAEITFLGNSLRPCEWLDLATGRSGCFRTLSFENGSSFGEIAFSPDGRIMAVGRWEEPLRLYSVADGNLLRELPDQQHACGSSVSFSPDNRWVAIISNDGVVSISDVQTGDLVHSLPAITSTRSVKFSPDGKYLTVGLAQSSLQFWRTTDWTVHWVIPVSVYSINFSVDGRWMAGETADNRVGIWKMDDGAVYRTIDGRVRRLALSPDGKQLATASYDAPISVWDVATGQLLRTIPADNQRDLAYSPDGQYLLASEGFIQFISYINQVSLWRVTDGHRIAGLPAYNNVGCAAFAAKSNVFAYSDWKSVKVFQLRQY